MTLDEVNALVARANAIQNDLDEFLPLFRKRHEKWTIQAYDQTLSDLRQLHDELFDRLFEVNEVRKELGENSLVDVRTGARTRGPETNEGVR